MNKSASVSKNEYFKKILLFSIPLMLTGVLQSLYNTADLIVVGRFDGELAFAAVGSTGALTNLILGLFMGISVGAGVCVAHGIGAKLYDDVQKTFHTAIATAAILGVFIGVVGYIFAPRWLHLMDTPDDVIDMASTYIRIIFLAHLRRWYIIIALLCFVRWETQRDRLSFLPFRDLSTWRST